MSDPFSTILQLYQRRLHNKEAVITSEEFLKATKEIAIQINFIEYRVARLRDAQKMLKKLIEKKDLYK